MHTAIRGCGDSRFDLFGAGGGGGGNLGDQRDRFRFPQHPFFLIYTFESLKSMSTWLDNFIYFDNMV